MVHTDRDSQYASAAYRKLLKTYDLHQSMSRCSNCWDNAVAESLFATLKKQAVHGERFTTREYVTQTIFKYIEGHYNRFRRHSTIGWLSRLSFERLYYQSLEDSSVH